MKVLVAEDENHLRILYQTVLEREGYDVILAENGKQTLEIIEKEQIDLTILDIKMPDMSGLDLLMKISKSKSHPPILINSAYPEYMEDFRCWAAEDFIVKSSDFTKLLGKIKEILIKTGKFSII